MPEEGARLGELALRQIQAVVRGMVLRAVRTHSRHQSKRTEGLSIYLAESPAGGIPAMSGTTAGSAECTIKYIDADGEVQTALDSEGEDVVRTIYNVSSSGVAASTIIQCKQECVGGALLADFEDCG